MNYVSREPALCNSEIPPTFITPDYPQQPSHYLTRDKERELIGRWQKHRDHQARDELIIAFQDLVRGAAAKSGLTGADFEDAVSQANLGLLRAADKFDLSRDSRFATYAAYWVWAFIKEYRRPTFSVVRRPRGAEIASDCSLDAPLQFGDDKQRDRLDSFIDENEESFDELEQYDGRRQALMDALSTLSDRERRILEARQLSDQPPRLQELGDQFKVSRERARQIETIALQKVKRSVTSARLGELARGLAIDAFAGKGNRLSRSHLIERRYSPSPKSENYYSSKEVRCWVLGCRP